MALECEAGVLVNGDERARKWYCRRKPTEAGRQGRFAHQLTRKSSRCRRSNYALRQRMQAPGGEQTLAGAGR